MGDIPEEKTSACSKPFIRIKTILRRQKVILSQITMYCVLQRKSLPPRERPQVLLKEQSAMKTFPIVQKCNKNFTKGVFLVEKPLCSSTFVQVTKFSFPPFRFAPWLFKICTVWLCTGFFL